MHRLLLCLADANQMSLWGIRHFETDPNEKRRVVLSGSCLNVRQLAVLVAGESRAWASYLAATDTSSEQELVIPATAYVAESQHETQRLKRRPWVSDIIAEREVLMNLRNWTQTEENVELRNVRRKNSDAVRGTIVVTPGNILKFALFVIACFLVSIAIAEWLPIYLSSAP